MKLLTTLSILCISIVSCKKNGYDPAPDQPGPERKVQFALYSDHDLSTDNHTITFTAFIQNSANKILWDSAFAPIKIKEIPVLANKIFFAKTVSGVEKTRLKAGFNYVIENVGTTSFFDAVNPGDTLKTIDFNFQ